MKIKDKIYNIKRKKAINLITNNLGLVKEEEDEIICYVNKDKIEVNGANLSLSCYGIKDEHKKIAQKYNIDKPIHYVIKDLLITNKIYIFGYENCNVEIKNCSLKNDAGIHINGNLILDKTYIKTAPYILISAKDITLKNINDEDLACATHNYVGKAVRRAIEQVGGTMPENLPTPEKSLKQLEKESVNYSLK